jgi:hypothetical protein
MRTVRYRFVWGALVLWAGLLSLGACCRAVRCPKPIERVVERERPCALPPALTLPAVRRLPCGELKDAVACFDRENAAKLALRDARLKDWIREARRRCGMPTSAPTSRPTP